MRHTIKKIVNQGIFFTIASIVGNFLNLLFNFFLGHQLSPVDFSLVALFIGIMYTTNVFFNALILTTGHSVGISSISTRERIISRISFRWRKNIFIFAIIISIFWLVVSPFLSNLWKVSTISLVFFIPVFIFGTLSFLNRGILQGGLRFGASGLIFLAESGAKLFVAIIFVTAGMAGWAYIAIPVSVLISYIVSEWFLRDVSGLKAVLKADKISLIEKRIFPRRFFIFSFLLGLSTLTFLSIDVILVKIFFSAEDAGAYALITISGKILFLLSTLLGSLIVPIVSNAIGEKKNTRNIFRVFFLISAAAVLCGAGFFLIFGKMFFLLFFGEKVQGVIAILPLYIASVGAFSLVYLIVLYHHARRKFIFSIVSSTSAFFLVTGAFLFHTTLNQFVWVFFGVAIIDFVIVSILHLFSGHTLPHKISDEMESEILPLSGNFKNDKLPTVTIGIPAYNEQGNIGNILNQVLSQKKDGFVVNKIIVVSDGSTDNTVNIASKYLNEGVEVIPRRHNRGLNYTQNEIIKDASTDILVLLNADILLNSNEVLIRLIAPILNGADLSASWTLPLAPRTFMERILCAGFELKYYVYTRFKNGDNIYTCIGANRALSKRFYKNVSFPLVSDGEDQYLYLFCLSGGYKYKYAGPVNTYFKFPDNFIDYKKYAKRIFQTQKKYRESFGEIAVIERVIPKMLIIRGCVYALLGNPFYTSIYIVMHVMMQRWALKQVISSSHTFEVSTSTKKSMNADL